jgi:hypothetical protein
MASLSGVFNVQEFSDAGGPLASGRLYTYEQGTTTFKAAYTDIAGTIPHTYTSDGTGGLYIGLNARGELQAPLYLASGAYDIALKRYDGSTVWTRRADGASEIASILASNLAASTGAAMVGRGTSTVAADLTAAESGIAALGAKLTATTPHYRTARPAFIEQHISGFFGRGMLTAETINVATEQALVGDYAVGAATLAVTSATNFTVGGSVAIKHDNGLYRTYFVDSKSGNNIGIRPTLRNTCTAALARIERTWYNRAHPGKFYMRWLAQRIANSTELDAAMPDGRRVLYTNVASNPNTLEDTLIAVGSAAITYYDASDLGGDGTTATPVRFALGRTAYVGNILAVGDGIKTQQFDVGDVANAVVQVAFLAAVSATQFSIQVFDELDVERGKYIIPSGSNSGAMQIYALPADLRGAKRIYVRVACETYVSSAYFTVDQIDVFEAPEAAGKIIANPAAKIVVLGDSWVGGDLGSTPEREPITTQLALELPYATIINAGVGGNKVTDELARFDTDVTPYAPDYVVINTGTNECYSPLSGTFDPTAIDAFINTYRTLINKIIAIGARPIILGVPALAQSDADVSAFPEWQLNDRAKAYARYVFERMATKPVVTAGTGTNGDWTKFKDGTLICRKSVSVTTTAALTLAGVAWTFPIQFIAAPKVTTAISSYTTSQLLACGTNGTTATGTSVYMSSGTAGFAATIDCVAVGRWRA